MPADRWAVQVIEGCPAGSRVCLGCGALVLDDVAAVEQHQLYHATIERGVILDPRLVADTARRLQHERTEP